MVPVELEAVVKVTVSLVVLEVEVLLMVLVALVVLGYNLLALTAALEIMAETLIHLIVAIMLAVAVVELER